MAALQISETQICNMALSHIGTKSHIANLQEKSAEARECNIWFEYVRLVLLEGYDWGFARKRIALVDHADTPSTSSGVPYAGVVRVRPFRCRRCSRRYWSWPGGNCARWSVSR